MSAFGIFSVFSLLSEKRAGEVARQMDGVIGGEDGAPFTWAREQDHAGDLCCLLPQVLGLLDDDELRTLALSWNVDTAGGTRRFELMRKLEAVAHV